MREEAVIFGVDSPLAGIVTMPDAGVAAALPVFLFFNSGIGHRVGPNRMYVPFARKLAGAGITSLRFDFSGIGDSPASPSLTDPEERAVGEASQAMDYIGQRFGADAFVPVGLCSGANVGFVLTLRDQRVRGAVLINPATIPGSHTPAQYAEAQKRSQSQHYASRLTDPKSWMRALTGRSNLIAAGNTAVRFARRALGVKESSAKSPDLGLLPELNERGVELLAVYTKGDLGIELLMTHVGRPQSLSSLERFQLEILSDTDHVLTPLWAQRRLEELVFDWAARRLSVGQAMARGTRDRSAAPQSSVR